MEFKDIKFDEVKTYRVSKAVKLALLKGVTVSEGELPAIPAENAVASEEALILGMTNLTSDDLDTLTDEEHEKVLEKINEITTVPTDSSGEK